MPEAEPSGRVDVLYVEDDAAWARLVPRWLKSRGLNVQHVDSGAKLHKHLDSAAPLPRCVLLDLVLRDADGLELCDQLKRSPKYQSLPVIILTGAKIDAVKVLKHRAMYRVEKGPKSEDELAAIVDAVLAQQKWDQGVIDVDDLRLDPAERKVFLNGREIARLSPGPFSALSLLARSSPVTVADEALYQAFLSRHSYRSPDHELAVRHVLRNYVSLLRRDLGKPLGERITRVEAGYSYNSKS